MLRVRLLTLLLKIQSLQRHDICETAQEGQNANKGQNKGRIWAMIMQLSGDPSHEYGSYGGSDCWLMCVLHTYKVSQGMCACVPKPSD